jgi:hypothetical protein
MVRISILAAFLFLPFFSYPQTFQPERVTTWENAGLTTELQSPTNQVLITDFGADNTGISNSNSAYTNAIASLNGEAGTIYFPQGEYLFTSALSVPDSVFLKGESPDTELKFDLGGTGNLIVMNGSVYPTQLSLAVNAVKGSFQVQLTDASSLLPGDVVRLYQFDEDYMFSTWAYGTLGQIVEITQVSGNTLTLANPLNHNYPLVRNPYLKKLAPRVAAGIECLKLKRLDSSVGQTSNIYIGNAFNCVIRNIESENCNFSHLEINSSSHIQVEGSYFHHAFAYGGGGQGYGVVNQVASSFCLIQNNIFNHLRHSMLIQSGANGNVFGYNYSYDPYWENGFLPNNSAGDAVLHGNYTYMNLFEGNTVQHMVIDASHGSNGSHNAFFRNRGELYGFFSDNGTPTDSMSVVGNVITNSGFPLGLFMLNGVGHYSYGNNHSGTVTPSGTSSLSTNTLYLNENDLPAFLSQETLPMVGYPLAMNQKLLPAESRFITEDYVECSSLITSSGFVQNNEGSKFVLRGNILEMDSSVLPATLDIYSINGALLQHQILTSTRETLSLPNGNGMLLIRAESLDGLERATFKHISFY